MTAAVDLLAIGAHPDDVEIGCGGTLILAGEAGLNVAIADLTRGELATHGAPPLREQEGHRAARLLGVRERVCLGLPDGRLGSGISERDAVVALIRDLRPRVVLAPYPEDRHPDHAAAGQLVHAASFFAGVERAGHGQPHRPSRLYHYMIHHPFEPSFVIDISSVWERKLEAVASYESQFDAAATRTEIGGRRFLRLLDDRASFHGSLVGFSRGEPFYSRGPLGLDAPPGAGADRGREPGAYRAVL